MIDDSIFAASDSLLRFPSWQRAYESTLQSDDTHDLFKLVEIAEAAIRVRRDLLTNRTLDEAERQAIEKALRRLEQIKQDRLGFFGATLVLPTRR